MKRYFLFAACITISSSLFAQLDIKAFKKIQIGVMYDRTDVTGLYTIQDPNTLTMEVDKKDYRTTINAEIKYFESNERAVVNANLEGFLYLLGRLIDLARKDELFYDWDSPLDRLSAGDCKNLKLKSGDNYNEVARFTNNHFLDISALRAIKEGPALIGVNLSGRFLGFPPRYSIYATEEPKDRYMISTMGGTIKVLFGLGGGYRASLGDKSALFIIGGVNTAWNRSDKDPDKSNAIHVKYHTFINPTIFFGGKFGGYVGLYWEMMKGKDVDVNIVPSYSVVGAPTPSQTTYKTKVSESQLLLKLGIYFTGKNE